MRINWLRPPKAAVIGVVGFALGVLVGAKLMRPPQEVHRGPAAAAAGAALDRILPEVELNHVPLDRAVEVLSRLAGVRIDVEWNELAKAGVRRTKPVTFLARNTTLDQVLGHLANADGIKVFDLGGYFPSDDRVVISAGDDLLARATTVGTYDVRDLDLPEPPATPPSTSGRGLFSSTYQDIERPRDVIEYVADMTGYGTGQSSRFVRYFAGRLIVEGTWKDHRNVARALAQLREPPPVAVPPPDGGQQVWDDAAGAYVSSAGGVAESALRRRLPEVRFDGETLERAVAALQQASGARIVIDWEAAEARAVLRKQPVTFWLTDVTLSAALRGLLDAGHLHDFAIGPRGGFVEVVPPEHVQCLVGTRTYDVAALLKQAASTEPLNGTTRAAEPFDPAHRLCDVIRANVGPVDWIDTGGQYGTMHLWGDRLIVRQSWENHEKLAEFLGWLRRIVNACRPF